MVLKREIVPRQNFIFGRKNIELLLAFQVLSAHLEERPTLSCVGGVRSWQKYVAEARVISGVSLSDDHLEHVRGMESASEMWSSIQNLF